MVKKRNRVKKDVDMDGHNIRMATAYYQNACCFSYILTTRLSLSSITA